MTTRRRICFVVAALFCLYSQGAIAQDAAGCKDPQLFTRMPGFYIDDCDSQDFDQQKFYTSDEKEVVVEGKKTRISYVTKKGGTPPSEIQILRNFANAIKKIGGSVQLQTRYDIHLNLIKDGAETWVLVKTSSGDSYTLIIVEKKAMVQDITASAMLDALNKQGFMALYINFDTNKATVKPDSKPIIDEMVTLLKGNPDLKVSVEGHTDSTGTPAKNKTLSQERAQSVVNALVGAGIDKKRLNAVGWGQDNPIADNRTEEGKAKNRRVEIVKK
jgi:outer membrane protein OmpA-like peptidoglycan-associated protein